MIPRITFGVVVLLIVAYIVGARWPGLATRFGLA
jgi:hypothetical protein